VTKAVHIEVVTSLSTEAFLAVLRRFITRRGKPRTICSDNGTNIQGAANELHAVYKMFQSTSHMATVQDFLALLTLLMSNAIDFPGGKPTNKNLNSSGYVGHPTTSRVCNSVNAGRGHSLTYNQVISSS